MGGMTTSSRTQTVFHDCWMTYKVSTLYRHTLHTNPPRRLFEGSVYFTQRLQLCGVYSRAASIRGNTVSMVKLIDL